MLKQVIILCLLATPALAREADRCRDTSQLLRAAENVDKRMGGYIEGRNVALGLMKQNGKDLGPLVKPDDIDHKRIVLDQIEMWALGLEDDNLKVDYLCAIMQRRRALDDAALELVDHHLQREMEGKGKSIPSPPK